MVHCCVPGCVVTGGKKRFSNAIKIYSLALAIQSSKSKFMAEGSPKRLETLKY